MKEEYYEKSEVDLVLAKLYDFCDKSIDMLNLEEDRYENLVYIKIQIGFVVKVVALAGANISPISMIILLFFRSMLEGVKSIQQMAVEAKEEQKTRVLLWDMQNGDDEEDDGW